MIKGTKLDFYSVACPSPFAHRQITWHSGKSQICTSSVEPAFQAARSATQQIEVELLSSTFPAFIPQIVFKGN